MKMPDQLTSTALATAVLRVSLGIMFFAHGVVLKLLTFGLTGTVAYFESIGLPALVAYLVFVAETVGGLLLILGIKSRWVALALSPILLGSLIVHGGNGWVFSAPNGGWEYPVYLFVLCIVQAMLGDGAYALGPRLERSQLPGSKAVNERRQA